MRWPLRYQIVVPFALTMLAAIAAVSVLSAVLATQRQIEQQLQEIAATLADSSFPLTDVVLRQMHGLSGCPAASSYPPAGGIFPRTYCNRL